MEGTIEEKLLKIEDIEDTVLSEVEIVSVLSEIVNIPKERSDYVISVYYW